VFSFKQVEKALVLLSLRQKILKKQNIGFTDRATEIVEKSSVL
jgi:hypothetical protein